MKIIKWLRRTGEPIQSVPLNQGDRFYRLTSLIEKLIAGRSNPIVGCVVVNERGLIIVDKIRDNISRETLAAMITLVSGSILRANKNLNLGAMDYISIQTSERYFFILNFKVSKQQFRIGAIAQKARFSPWGRNNHRNMEKRLRITAQNVIRTLAVGS